MQPPKIQLQALAAPRIVMAKDFCVLLKSSGILYLAGSNIFRTVIESQNNKECMRKFKLNWIWLVIGLKAILSLPTVVNTFFAGLIATQMMRLCEVLA